MDLDDDELKATKELFFSDKKKIKKALEKLYIYKSDALLYADDKMLEALQDVEKILKGDSDGE